MKAKVKKPLVIVSAVIGSIAIIGGIVFAVRTTTQKSVTVIPVSDMSTFYWGDDVSMGGSVTTSATQEIQLSEQQLVDQVLVEEGQEVDVGTPLMTYDMTLVDLELESEKINRQTLDIKKKGLQDELKKLRNAKVIQTSSADGSSARVIPMVLTDKPKVKLMAFVATPDQVVAYEQLTLEKDEEGNPIVNPYKGTGTQEDPYCFLVKWSDTYKIRISGEFLTALKTENAVMRLEMREGDVLEGAIKGAIKIVGSSLGTYEDAKLYVADLVPREEVTPTPTPDPEASPTPDPENPDATPTPDPEVTPTPTETPTPTPGEGEDGDDGDDGFVDGDGDEGDGGFIDDGFGDGIIGEPIGPAEVPEEGYTKEEKARLIQEKQQELTQLELDIKQSDLTIQQTEKRMNDGTVTSTLKGIVKHVGDPAKGQVDGTAFIQVVSTEGLYIQGTISEMLLEDVQIGQRLQGTSYESGSVFEAEIREISPYPVDEGGYYGGANESYYPFTAYVDGETGLQNMEYVDLSLTVGEDSSNALYIPKYMVREENGTAYVYKADENNRLHRQEVATGRSIYGYYVEIRQGVTEEDRLAFPYGNSVKEGAKTVDGTLEQLYM